MGRARLPSARGQDGGRHQRHRGQGTATRKKPNAQYAYIAPYYAQAKRVAFDYLLRYTTDMRSAVNIAELTVTLLNGAKIFLFGADNPDALRGIYLDGCVMDEPAMMRARVFTEVIRPLLADRQGWCVWIGTPAGKNEFFRIVTEARTNPATWFYLELKASQSNLLAQEELDDVAQDHVRRRVRAGVRVLLRGGDQRQLLRQAHQRAWARGLATCPTTRRCRCMSAWTSASPTPRPSGCGRCSGTEVRYVRAFEDSGLAISDYVDRLRGQPYVYGDIWVPPDAKAKSLQTGLSVVQLLHRHHGIRPKLVPALSVQQGIQASRFMLQSCYIDDDALRRGGRGAAPVSARVGR